MVVDVVKGTSEKIKDLIVEPETKNSPEKKVIHSEGHEQQVQKGHEIKKLRKIQKANKELLEKIEVVRKSLFYKEVVEQLAESDIKYTKVRCIALGSITEEPLLLYQYLFLVLLVELLSVDVVTLWDPVFNDTDREIFTSRNHKVSEKTDSSKDTFYFMPHIPIEVFDDILANEKPTAMLTNNISLYSTKWSDLDLYSKFKYIALLMNSCDIQKIDTCTDSVENGFQIASGKKKRRNRNKYVPQKVVYDYQGCYFDTCTTFGLVSSKDLTSTYGTSFSDMSLYHLKATRL